MKANIGLKTWGVRGGTPNWKNNVGQVSVVIDSSDDFISVDAFVGAGGTYTRREKSLINIEISGAFWSGTAEELARTLSKPVKKQYVLFGGIACRVYNIDGIDELILQITEEKVDYHIYVSETNDDPLKILEEYNGWNDHVIITEEDYLKIQNRTIV